MKYNLVIATTDLDDLGLAHAAKVSANPDVQTLLLNRLQEFIGATVATYLGTVQGLIGDALQADPTKLDPVAKAAGVDVAILTAADLVMDPVKP